MAENTIGSRLFDMLNRNTLTDVTFIVQDTEVKGHRVIVGSRGGILLELLETNESDRIEICPEIAPQTFKTVLQYMYTDKCDVNNKNLFEMMHAAESFGLEHLRGICSETFQRKLSYTNVGLLTTAALQFGAHEKYVKACQDYFKSYLHYIINQKEFLDVSFDALLTLCNIDCVGNSGFGHQSTATLLFNGCLNWAKAECQRKKCPSTPKNIRRVLGNILCNNNFTNMPQQDFLNHVVQSDVLTTEEVGQIVIGYTKNTRKPWVERVEKVDIKQPLPEHGSYPKKMNWETSILTRLVDKRILFAEYKPSTTLKKGLTTNFSIFNSTLGTDDKKTRTFPTDLIEYKDNSLEELRWEDYKSGLSKKGFAIADIGEPYSSKGYNFGFFFPKPTIIETSESGSAMTTTGSGFFGLTSAKPSATSSIFGGASTTSVAVGGLFGSTSAKPSATSSIFGGASTTSGAVGGSFGLTSAKPSATSSIFGGPSTTSGAVGGLFGSTSAKPSATSSIFGGGTITSSAGGFQFNSTSAKPSASSLMFSRRKSAFELKIVSNYLEIFE